MLQIYNGDWVIEIVSFYQIGMWIISGLKRKTREGKGGFFTVNLCYNFYFKQIIAHLFEASSSQNVQNIHNKTGSYRQLLLGLLRLPDVFGFLRLAQFLELRGQCTHELPLRNCSGTIGGASTHVEIVGAGSPRRQGLRYKRENIISSQSMDKSINND